MVAVPTAGGGPPRHKRSLTWTPVSEDPSLARVFGGSLRCASVAAGGVSDGSVAVVTVSSADPCRICVWHVFLARAGSVDVRPLGAVRLGEEDGRCIACLTAPSAGTLFAWSDRGTVSRCLWRRFISPEATPPRADARLYKATAAAVTGNGQFVVTVDTARGVRVLDGASMETVGQSVTAGSVAAEAVDKARGAAGGAQTPGEPADAPGGRASPLTVSFVHPSLVGGDGGSSEEDHAYWGVLLSPSGTVVLALRGDGVVTAWALTTALRDGDLARSYAVANGSGASRGVAGDGVFARICGGWDVLAAVQAGGQAQATKMVMALGNGESSEGLRVGLLSTSSAPPGVLAILESGRTGSGSHGEFQLRNPANVASVIAAEVGKGPTPSAALAAAPLADWVLNLCAVWLRRANQMRLRIEVAERALGLRGSAKGAGYLLSRTCPGQGRAEAISLDPSDDTAELFPYEIVTGRPLPPWAPLRRCVTSGLLAAEMTAGGVSGGPSPWAARWDEESPLGGLWARVPSVDLDRYDLLPAVMVSRPDG
ncbi:hypothetical protein I4F81_011463 [Pyropia yezoensis]|uniref:Uncharacterized protein n=1 Tax=Pyropia yezoensis TaxID=2788 RepID=A0ACC3CFE1_PYRYE|nr:hypothetical protein I4F81_011463 [Neopyropia yezoensis]